MAKKIAGSALSGPRVFKHYHMRWTGIKPLLCHNIQLANPLLPICRRIAELVKLQKQNPTDENVANLIHTEWLGGLYLDRTGRPIVKSDAIEATIAARSYPTLKGGKKETRAAIDVLSNPLIQHGIPGVHAAQEMWEYSLSHLDDMGEGYFLHYGPVDVQGKVVMRSKPKFPNWKLEFDIRVNVGVIDDNIWKILMRLAEDNGLLDYRPKFGLFEATWEEFNPDV